MYVELVEHNISNRGNIVELGTVQAVGCAYERYFTMFPYDNGIYDYKKQHGGVANYPGQRYAPMIFIDIDSADPEEAFNDLINFIQHLYDTYGLSQDDLYIYFSGAKGFHVGIHYRTLGYDKNKLFNDVGERAKHFVDEISNITIDGKIYDRSRIFRVVNSLNKKSGLYKVPLNYEELQMGFGMVGSIAEEPRENFVRAKQAGQIRINEKLASIWNGYKKTVELSVGNRNNSLFSQACFLYDKGLPKDSVYTYIGALNDTSEDPLYGAEVNQIVESAAKKTNYKEHLITYGTVGQYAQEWYDSLRPEINKLSLGFDRFDREMRGKLRGKLGVILGKGGTKKSLFAQNIAAININESRMLYSTMEMGAAELINRFVNMTEINEGAYLQYLERENEANPGAALREFEKNVAPYYSDKLIISQNSGMTADEYAKMIDDVELKHGKIDILIPDGLSMMGGKGTETELANRHSKELKELAKDRDIFIPLIVHVTKEGDQTTRDLSRFARASEKIIDNCDFYISMSLFTDHMGKYVLDRGNARLVNKRGTGNIIDVVYDFNQSKLSMRDNGKELADYDTQQKDDDCPF